MSIENIINSLLFRNHVERCTGMPGYHRIEHAFVVFTDNSYSDIFVGTKDCVEYEVKDSSFLIAVHYHPSQPFEPSEKDLVTSFCWSVEEFKNNDNIPYFGILSKTRKGAGLFTYSLRPLIKRHEKTIRSLEITHTKIRPDKSRVQLNKPQTDPVKHLLFDELLFKCDYLPNAFTIRDFNELTPKAIHRRYSEVDTLEVLPIKYFKEKKD